MNERIKELAEQVYGETHYDDFKFAELIVWECLNICEELGDKGMDGHYCADRIVKLLRS